MFSQSAGRRAQGGSATHSQVTRKPSLSLKCTQTWLLGSSVNEEKPTSLRRNGWNGDSKPQSLESFAVPSRLWEVPRLYALGFFDPCKIRYVNDMAQKLDLYCGKAASINLQLQSMRFNALHNFFDMAQVLFECLLENNHIPKETHKNDGTFKTPLINCWKLAGAFMRRKASPQTGTSLNDTQTPSSPWNIHV